MVKRFGLIVAGCALALYAASSAGLAQPQKVGPKIAFGPTLKLVSMSGEIDGAIHTLTGVPLAAGSVQVLDAQGSTRATLTADGTGHFRIELVAGTYAVVVNQPGYVRLRIGNIVVTPGSKVPVNFSLAVMPTSALSGAILHSPSQPVIGLPQPQVYKPVPAPAPKMSAPQPEPEQMILLHSKAPVAAPDGSPVAPPIAHPVAPPVASPGPDVAPVTAPPNPADAEAMAQAKAAEQAEQAKQQAVGAFVKSLPKGLITYTVPLQMRLNQPVTVKVSIFGAKAPASLAAAAAAAGGTAPASVPTSNYMQVYLSEEENPDAFSIAQMGDQSPKWVPSDGGTFWQWTVTPKSTGQAKLTFQTYVLFPDKAGSIPQQFDVKDETVTVTTPTLADYFHKAWDGFLTNPAVWVEYVLPGGTGFVILVWLAGRLKKKAANLSS